MIRVALRAYALARQSGLLNTRIGQFALDHAYFAYKRQMEDLFASLVRRHPELFRGGDILDVGANIGYTASVFAGVLSDGCHVYAFEPEEKNFEGLVRNVRRLALSSLIIPVRAAAGSRNGTAQFWPNPASHADSRVVTESLVRARRGLAGLQDVETITLDSFVRERTSNASIQFLKIDVQGYEMSVLEGARSLLDSDGITVATEIATAEIVEMGSHPDAIIDFLATRSFLPHTMDRQGRVTPCDRVRIAQLSANRGYIDVIWSRRILES